MILVTGGTGLVGAHLLLQLLQEEEKVKAIYRSSATISKTEKLFVSYKLESLFSKIEWVQADILDITSLENAFQEITSVYHCAALVSFDPKDHQKLLKTNIEGTANIVNCSLAFGVKNLCYVSSIAALGDILPNEILCTEAAQWNGEKYHSDYAISKNGAEMEVWRGQQEGLNVVIVNPGVIFGSGFEEQGSGLILQSIKKTLPFYTDGNIAYVLVEDVAKCMLLLMKNQHFGERYILVAETISYKKLFEIIANAFQLRKPTIEISKTVVVIASKLDWFLATFFSKKRNLSNATTSALFSTNGYDNRKIVNTLRFTFQKLEGSNVWNSFINKKTQNRN